ncbi:MAG: AAA family ATPase [Firmicutes bacterium]|nr:AAA family ATPase [Bacillota bacterium]
MKCGCKVLRGKYELIKPLIDVDGQPSKTWLAQDDFQNEYLIKLWLFSNKANELQRALWDFELRNLYRVSSSPGAEQVLLVIQDAGVDQEHQCFVMVMQAKSSGYEPLEEALYRRSQFPWLDSSNRDVRRELWEGLRRIAEGIQLLHGQAMIHRDVCASNVFFHPDIGPTSFRLGRFEWSIKIGELHITQPPMGWSFPPEVKNWPVPGYQLETDWYGFGMLAVRCLLNVEAYRDCSPEIRHKQVFQRIHQASERYLSEFEKRILLRLINRNSRDRITQDYQVITAIDNLLQAFRGVQPRLTENPLLLLYNPRNVNNLVERANEVGFLPNPDIPDEPFNPHDLNHTINLSNFIQKDLTNAQIFIFRDTRYILVGNKLSYLITRFMQKASRTGETNYTWDAVCCLDVWDLGWSEGGVTQKELPAESIIVRTISEIWKQPTELNKAQSWKRYLPQGRSDAGLRAGLSQFHDFIRCTNQIELLIRDAELFQYEVIQREIVEQVETLRIREIERTRPVLEFFKIEGGLVEFLQRERESNRSNCSLVFLHENEALRYEQTRRIQQQDCYEVFGFEDNIVVLKKTVPANITIPPPNRGWLRTLGMIGQIDLIRRRKEAINRLSKHSYLLQSISSTGQVYMHIGNTSLPQPLSEDKVDKAKQAVMQDILNTRPIYALQGPPGTGKTTMVAHLLRQILDEDPVAQILVTAQAHGAVDVLWSKVRDEAFVDIATEVKLPLAVRLGRKALDEDTLEGSVELVAASILQQSIKALSRLKSITHLQRKWREHALEMKKAIISRLPDEHAPEFLELVKRGANITYCTTSAGDLEELARSTQTYDWTIIEEAGKCHGFDLALPMQAGHRWLLIGDHRQLPPYRFNDYLKAIADLDRTIDALRGLPGNAGGLLDNDWIGRWERMTPGEREQFKQFAKNRLDTFQYVFKLCEKTPAGDASVKKTINEPIGAIAGMLSWQYRMHPKIGDLISESYYEGELKNKTVDSEGRPLERVTINLTKPRVTLDGGVLWIDTPAASENDKAAELGPLQQYPRYINNYEANVIKGFLSSLQLDLERMPKVSQGEPLKLAVLSPYNQQVSNLREILKNVNLPDGVVAKEQLRTRKTHLSQRELSFIYTVDSFQGNEADIIIVSLVRNNLGQSQRPLGFLDEPERMNVLLSRAQRLLVLVGSWDFFKQQVEPFDLSDTSRSEWHLKKAITLLEDWFKSGIAIKLESGEFEVEEMV